MSDKDYHVRHQWFKWLLAITILIVALTASWQLVAWVEQSSFWRRSCDCSELYFLDIGQGDATLIHTPDGRDILIDGGPDNSVLYRLGEVMPFYDRTIDMVVLTHPDSDHMNGLIEVLKRYRIKTIVYNGIVDTSPAYRYFKELAAAERAEVVIAVAGQRFQFAEAELEILFPEASLASRRFDDTNESSIVGRYSFGDSDFLFSGDLPQAEERELVSTGAVLEAEVMKAGHHGSKTASAPEFIKAINPVYAVVSAGRNNTYGHPHYRTLHTLSAAGVEILRTDLRGTIHIHMSAKSLEIL